MHYRIRVILQQHAFGRVGAVGFIRLDHEMAQRQHAQADGDGIVAIGAGNVDVTSGPLEIADQR